ncbi:hypothetical protein ACT3SP_11875 [Brachybacterium sp. AOP43-C2-M15]|uniref:hypothetical protein n=1 Tax=Brachybacterium sp. AOP43-C2-M15 TaxID=3457661 RepID=UPI00403372B1
MHTGPQPQYPLTQQQQPSASGGRGTALLIGGIAFAIVFLLIVGGTVGYLVLRPGGTGGGVASPSTDTTAPEDPEATDPEATDPSESPTPTDVEEERCWSPDSQERTSSNPSGKLRGGGLQFIPPSIYDGRSSPMGLSHANDTQGAQALVEDTWYSTIAVGAVEWQPGIEYPGAEVASQKIVDCFFYASIWGEAKGRSLDDEITEPVTISGMPGYRTTAVVNFSSSPLEKTSATELVVVVIDTPQGPSVFVTETAVGVTEHEQAADEAYESLTGYS